jgi:hypothetical protein
VIRELVGSAISTSRVWGELKAIHVFVELDNQVINLGHPFLG